MVMQLALRVCCSVLPKEKMRLPPETSNLVMKSAIIAKKAEINKGRNESLYKISMTFLKIN